MKRARMTLRRRARRVTYAVATWFADQSSDLYFAGTPGSRRRRLGRIASRAMWAVAAFLSDFAFVDNARAQRANDAGVYLVMRTTGAKATWPPRP